MVDADSWFGWLEVDVNDEAEAGGVWWVWKTSSSLGWSISIYINDGFSYFSAGIIIIGDLPLRSTVELGM